MSRTPGPWSSPSFYSKFTAEGVSRHADARGESGERSAALAQRTALRDVIAGSFQDSWRRFHYAAAFFVTTWFAYRLRI